VREIINGVQFAGVPASNIVVYDRYEYEIDIGSYQALLPPGVRVVGIQDGLVDSGYDPEVYCQATFFGEWENRSYMGENRVPRTDQNHQRSYHEGPLCLRGHGLPEELGLWHL
jgi:hypothetical protein